MPAHASFFKFGNLTIDLLSGCIHRGGIRVSLEPRAYDVLVHLVRHAVEVIPREALLDAIWRDVHVTPHSLTQAILQLRQALGDDRRKPRFIETRHRRGYRFIAPVRASMSRPPADAAVDSALSQPSIAVLPFLDMSAARDQEWFADGIAEEISNALTRIPGLKVIARTSAFAFKHTQQDVRRIAALLGVGHVLEGSVRTAGSRLRVTAQLINAQDGSHIWSDQYTGDVTDVFDIQESAATAIAGALEVKLSAPSMSRRGTANIAAYQAYLEAVEAMQRGLEPDPFNLLYRRLLAVGLWHANRLDDAERELRRVLELDESFARAHYTLGAICAQRERFGEALELTQRAHELIPENPIVLGQLAALVLRAGDRRRADSLLDQLRRGEAHGTSIGFAVFHATRGEIQTACDWAVRVIEQRYPQVVHVLRPLLCGSARWPALAATMNLPAS
ncbi:MAG TPA: winged helix-turn-helix domain-containing protein [Vicinamibacterales bacterium]